MHVSQLWRYPVKSLAGERVSTLNLAADGVEGDRAWGILDRADGRILTGRREPPLLFATSRLGSDGQPCITLPDGRELVGPGPATDEALSAWLGKSVTLVAAVHSEARRAEYFADATDDSSRAIEWTMPEGRFVDSAPLLVLTTAGLRGCAGAYPGGAWDVRRFRPNVSRGAAGDSSRWRPGRLSDTRRGCSAPSPHTTGSRFVGPPTSFGATRTSSRCSSAARSRTGSVRPRQTWM